jgi:hypothetical protein
MSIQEFSAWLRAAHHQVLAFGAAKLGHACLYGLPEAEREEAKQALTLLAGHASPPVRLALSIPPLRNCASWIWKLPGTRRAIFAREH